MIWESSLSTGPSQSDSTGHHRRHRLQYAPLGDANVVSQARTPSKPSQNSTTDPKFTQDQPFQRQSSASTLHRVRKYLANHQLRNRPPGAERLAQSVHPENHFIDYDDVQDGRSFCRHKYIMYYILNKNEFDI
jgi:hypothetical protein